MKNQIVLYPMVSSNEVLVQFSTTVLLDKNVSVYVPAEYLGIIYINEMPVARIENANANLLKVAGKSNSGKMVKIGFVRKNDLPFIPWGFGDVPVKNEKLREAYRVGTNGKYLLKVVDPIKLVKTFGTQENVTIEILEHKTKAFITTIGKPLLSKYFAGTRTSVFEINSLADDLREKMLDALKQENIFKDSGLELHALTLNGIHVDEDDLNLIRDRINNQDFNKGFKKSELDNLKREILEAISDGDNDSIQLEIKKLKDEMNAIIENQQTDTVIEEIDNLRIDMMEALEKTKANQVDMAPIMEEINNLKSSLSSIKEAIDSIADEKSQEKMPLYETAKEEWLNNLKITTDLLLDKAENDDDYASVAGLVFSNVESNLIDKFNIPHKDRNFYMTLAEKEEIDDVFSRAGINAYNGAFKDRKLHPYGDEIEMPVEVRFYKCGLTPSEAIQASRDWSALNKYRHRSEENKTRLDEILKKKNMTKKEFLKSIIDSYRKYGLFTRE